MKLDTFKGAALGGGWPVRAGSRNRHGSHGALGMGCVDDVLDPVARYVKNRPDMSGKNAGASQ